MLFLLFLGFLFIFLEDTDTAVSDSIDDDDVDDQLAHLLDNKMIEEGAPEELQRLCDDADTENPGDSARSG